MSHASRSCGRLEVEWESRPKLKTLSDLIGSTPGRKLRLTD